MDQQTSTFRRDQSTYVAWSLYTGPARPKALWQGSRWITGNWNGRNVTDAPAIKKDIDARVHYLIRSFEVAVQNTVSDQATNFFVVPEFYFHCKQGPYPQVAIHENEFPFDYLHRTLKERLSQVESGKKGKWIICAGSALTCNVPDIRNFLEDRRVSDRLRRLNQHIPKMPRDLTNPRGGLNSHIKAHGYFTAHNTSFGSEHTEAADAIDVLIRSFRADPLCVVRNRGLLLCVQMCSGKTEVCSWIFEKQYESNVDLTIGVLDGAQLRTGGMITEWLAGYPSISILGGDKHTQHHPSGARISIDEEIEAGVEICLDHRLKRLRRTVKMTKATGASADNLPLNIQLIPSGGMQIQDASVAAGPDGVIFNSDGCDPILDKYSASGKQVIKTSGCYTGIACGVFVRAAQAMSVVDSQAYYSHSQLCFRSGRTDLEGYNNALGTKNPQGLTYERNEKKNEDLVGDFGDPVRVPIHIGNTDDLYAASLGELHVYAPRR